MSGIDIASNSALLSVADKIDAQNVFLAAIAGKQDALQIKDWITVQAIVRAGVASKVFSIGDQFVCNHNTYGELVWDIIGFDCDTPSNSQFKHSMTLQLHDCVTRMQYDAMEALYYCSEELAAGTYYFTIHNYDIGNGGNLSYYFTLENNIPKGGQINFNWDYKVNAADCKVSTYESAFSIQAIETVGVTQGVLGTFLGTVDGKSENVNYVDCLRFGNNKWSESCVRMWLNSAGEAGTWWTPTSNFDRIPEAISNAGFLNGMDEEFLSIIGKVKKRTALNTIENEDSYSESDELVFLLSRSEVFAGLDDSVDEGGPYPYYKEFSAISNAETNADSNRIKRSNGSEKYWWLRSPNPSNAYGTMGVGISGVVGSYFAEQNHWLAPACCIV